MREARYVRRDHRRGAMRRVADSDAPGPEGLSGLAVDKATFPSDTISTHIIWPHGAEIMDRWGLLDRLAATGCPPMALNLIFDVGPFALKGGVTDTNGGRGGFCPRRTVLDKLLVDAAVEAGVELREAFTVEALLWDGDRVAGIKGHSRTGGSDRGARARIVIGADGVHSLWPSRPRAGVRRSSRRCTANYYCYFSGFAGDDIEEYVRDHQAFGCFADKRRSHPHRGAVARHRFPKTCAATSRATSRQVLESTPTFAARVRERRREEKWYGTAGVPGYFRKPFGQGWALVGDASYNRDPITAQGISDAFIDAEMLCHGPRRMAWSGAAQLDDALAAHEATRDQRVTPMYEFTCQLATLEPPPPDMQRLSCALRGNQDATNPFFSAITGAIPLPDFMNRTENLGRIMAAAKRWSSEA